MDYSTPGVYVREVDSGPKPIAAAATSIPGFLGLFEFKARADAIALTAASGDELVSGKLLPALVDAKGVIARGKGAAAGAAMEQAFGFRKGQVRDMKTLLELNGHKVTFTNGEGTVKITAGKTSVSVDAASLSPSGQVLVAEEDEVGNLWDAIHQTFALDKPEPKKAGDLMKVYGYDYESAEETALMDVYSVPPWPVTNKSEFFRWLQSFFAQYLCDTRDLADVVGDIEDADEKADAVFDALQNDASLRKEFQDFLSQPTVFNFVASVNGFYDNGGGKAYVYLMGAPDTDSPVRENQAEKLGLYAFDDCDDMSLHLAPGLSPRQQKEMLEHCEVRKDRFAILDGPLVSMGDMEIPASEKGYGALYVPWVKVAKPSWYTGEQTVDVTGSLARRLIRADSKELLVPPSGHVAGVYARVDGERGVHKAPANELLLGITGISQTINKLEQGQYNDRGINVIRTFKDRGTRIWGARTLATKSDPSWKYINVRRLFIMVEQSIMSGSQWAVFEPNDKFLWTKLSRDVRSFLMRIWRSGALFGATAEEAFYVKCDSETNPAYLVDAGQLNVQIGISPVKPAEFVIFSIGQWDGGSDLNE